MLSWGIFSAYNDKTSLGLQVKCAISFSNMEQIWSFSIGFHNVLQYQISRKAVQSELPSCMRTDGTIRWHDEATGNANAPEKWKEMMEEK